MRRLFVALFAACAGIAAVVGWVLGGNGGATAATSTMTPVADAHVQADSAGSNLGTSTKIRVDGSPAANGYLRFNVDVPTGEAVTQAKLKLFTASSSGSGFTVHRVGSTSWSETSITYDDAPSIGSQIAASGSYPGNSYVAVDVTSAVSGNGPVSFAIKRTSTSSNTYNSREAGSDGPQLVVETTPVGGSQTVVYALGDGADGSAGSRELADYVKAQNPDRFFYLGDVYETGTATEFANNYEPTYGSLAAKTDPVIGNHEYANRSIGYYPYWQNKRGWTQEQAKHRSYVDAASGWQIIAYSSETDMTSESSWVAAAVAKHPGTCRVVMAHKGRHVVTDTHNNDNTTQESVWSQIINKAAINLVGHNHVYGRLAPLSGVHVIVSGAGGERLRSLGSQHHEVADSQTGVPTATMLVLRRGQANFTQVDKNGTVYDSGAVTCTPAS